MNQDKSLSKAVGSIALAYVFAYFHFKINNFDLVPNWVCYVLIWKDLAVLGQEQRSVLLLRPLAAGLGIWEGIVWIFPNFGGSLTLIPSVVGLYFHFQLLTDLAAIAEGRGWGDTKKLLNLRTWRTVLATVMALPIDYGQNEAVVLVMLAAGMIVMVWTVAVLFSLRNFVERIDVVK